MFCVSTRTATPLVASVASAAWARFGAPPPRPDDPGRPRQNFARTAASTHEDVVGEGPNRRRVTGPDSGRAAVVGDARNRLEIPAPVSTATRLTPVAQSSAFVVMDSEARRVGRQVRQDFPDAGVRKGAMIRVIKDSLLFPRRLSDIEAMITRIMADRVVNRETTRRGP